MTMLKPDAYQWLMLMRSDEEREEFTRDVDSIRWHCTESRSPCSLYLNTLSLISTLLFLQCLIWGFVIAREWQEMERGRDDIAIEIATLDNTSAGTASAIVANDGSWWNARADQDLDLENTSFQNIWFTACSNISIVNHCSWQLSTKIPIRVV